MFSSHKTQMFLFSHLRQWPGIRSPNLPCFLNDSAAQNFTVCVRRGVPGAKTPPTCSAYRIYVIKGHVKSLTSSYTPLCCPLCVLHPFLKWSLCHMMVEHDSSGRRCICTWLWKENSTDIHMHLALLSLEREKDKDKEMIYRILFWCISSLYVVKTYSLYFMLFYLFGLF